MGKSKLKIHVLANDGSPLGVTEKSIHGLDGRVGVGGAELAILTLLRGWHEAGHDVTFYNSPNVAHGSEFTQLPVSLFLPQEYRDVLIIFRSPNKRAEKAVAGRKIWFSTDQYTVGDFAKFAQHVDQIVTISKFHADHFRDAYQINDTTIIDLPVRTWEYDFGIEKIPNRMIFCSVPDRGLAVLAECYDDIKKHVPDASLVITSDYKLWGSASPMNEKYIRKFMGKSDVQFLGAVSRKQMIEEQLRAEVHPYSCTYDELFCYASAECQVAGAFPITSQVGALTTTNMGLFVPGSPGSSEWKKLFTQVVVEAMREREKFQLMAKGIQKMAIERFDLNKILLEWDKVLYGKNCSN